jgi:glycosyltransferase involved in cell wall biosynthesis
MKISAVIPTCENRWDAGMTFRSLPNLSRKPDEVLVVMDGDKEKVEKHTLAEMPVKVIYTRHRGAAAKRNLGLSKCEYENVLFVDDDIEFMQDCLAQMERCLQDDRQVGAVGAFIENQPYREPGFYSRFVWGLMASEKIDDYAGRCFGPLINIWPKRILNGFPFQKTDWISIACALYRKCFLPNPAFERFFQGYSFMEDVTLSTEVGLKWQVGMARDALVVHHSKPAVYRKSPGDLHSMILRNRFKILTQVKHWNACQAAREITKYELLMVPAHIWGFLKGGVLIPILKANVLEIWKMWGQVNSGTKP